MEKAFLKSFNEEEQSETVESVWVEKQGENYILQNTPFFAYLYAYQDVVSVEMIDGDKAIINIIECSGNSSVRILFFDIDYMPIVRERLDKAGYSSEASPTLCMLAVNIPKESSYLHFLNIIKDYCEKGIIDYEESALTEAHGKEIL
jgi:hypothetical protein